MICVLDTHALVWFLQKDKKLPKKVVDIILNEEESKQVPFIVLCEIHYLHHHNRFGLSALEVRKHLEKVASFEIMSHVPDQLEYLDQELDIHDALIVASARALAKASEEEVVIFSRDEQIKKYASLPVLWE